MTISFITVVTVVAIITACIPIFLIRKGTLLWPQFCGSGKTLRNNIHDCYIHNVMLLLPGKMLSSPVTFGFSILKI